MTIARSIAFNLAFYLWTAFLCFALVWMPLLPRRRMMRIVRWYLSTVDWLERRVIGLDHVLIGRENLPEGAFIAAIKHQSAWETMKLHLWFDDPAIVLKRELMWIPIWGWYARAAGMIAIDRGSPTVALRSMIRNAAGPVAEGRPIAVFPQGTRTVPGAAAPYRAGVGALHDKYHLPVVPIALNSGLFWPRRGFIKRPGTVTVEILPPIPADTPRSELMRRLEAELEAASDRLLNVAGK